MSVILSLASEFKKVLRLRQRVRYKTIGFNEQTNGLHVRYNFWYICLPYSANSEFLILCPELEHHSTNNVQR